MVDVVKLIRAVKCRDPLWDRKHAYYHDRAVTMGLWEEVAILLGVDSDSARSKWKGLRDTFRGELKKINKARIKGQNLGATNWEYYHEMLFVKDQIYSNRRCFESMLKTYMAEAAPVVDLANICKTEVVEGTDSFDPSLAASLNDDSGRRGSDSESESFQEKRLKAERIASEEDDDYNFLMSLLPQLRSLPTTRNLYIRLKMQELLYNEIVSLQMNNSS